MAWGVLGTRVVESATRLYPDVTRWDQVQSVHSKTVKKGWREKERDERDVSGEYDSLQCGLSGFDLSKPMWNLFSS